MKQANNNMSNSKKTKVLQCFRETYTKEWLCFVESKVSPHYAFCKVCSCSFNIAHENRSLISSDDLVEFYESVKAFYIATCDYILKKFPLNDEFLKHAEAADIDLKKSISYSSILYLNTIFDCIPTEKLNDLETEFALYQAENFSFETSRVDEIWHLISLMKNSAGRLKYEYLSTLIKNVLIVPHSNASSERIFSLVRKNMTIFRPNLSLETLNALLIEKVMMDTNSEHCYDKKFTKAQLKEAKSQYKAHLM